MQPAARVQAAIEIIDDILKNDFKINHSLKKWSRQNRYAGSKDRAEIRDLIFDAMRNLRSYSKVGGGMNGRAIMSAALHIKGHNLKLIFTGEKYAPKALKNFKFCPIGSLSDPELFNIPDWLWPIWSTDLAGGAMQVASALRKRANIFLRVNKKKSTREQAVIELRKAGIEATLHPEVKTCLMVINGKEKINQSMVYRGGLVEFQDTASQMSVDSLPDKLSGPILDYCAGAGGKALALASKYDKTIFAHDVVKNRMSDIPTRARRANARIEIIKNNNLIKNYYGLVFADVPCSGTGSWRRDPAGKWLLSELALSSLVKDQSKIINHASSLVRIGGFFVYATCSVLKRENSEQIDFFLKKQKSWKVIKKRQLLPTNFSDGFFYCYLQKC